VLFGIGCAFIAINHYELFNKPGIYSAMEITMGTIVLVLMIELARRSMGLGLPLIAAAFFLYAMYGNLLPDPLRHKGFAFRSVLAYDMLGVEGVFGTCLSVSASFIFLFILYAKFLQETGGGQVFIDLAMSAVGWLRGGPAKVAVIASCLFGSISGSAVANVAGTGTFTIPIMKKSGYKAPFAGAVEAVASSGGQFMPPIMGSAAFLISEILGIPYWRVAMYSLIPALLYYAALFFMVDLEAGKNGLAGMNRKELPVMRVIIKDGWTALLSPVVLVVLLVFMRWSPAKAAVSAIFVTLAASMINPKTRFGLKKLFEMLRDAAIGAIETAVACATVGIIVGSINQTGLGLKLSSILVGLAGGNLALLLVLTMITSLILGMGLPTVACYLVLAVMVAPALVDIGVLPIAAHLFIFYFGIISAITPPVALASYVAAGIAKAPFVKTSIQAFKLGLSAFILPYMFVYNPALILQGGVLEVVRCIFTACIGVYSLSVAIEGFLKKRIGRVEQALFAVAAITLIIPELITDIIGVCLFIVLMAAHWKQAKGMKEIVQN